MTKLHPLSPEVISRQATINIGLCRSLSVRLKVVAILCDFLTLFVFSGTIGHVAHGKSTVVKAISGVQVSKGTDLASSLVPYGG